MHQITVAQFIISIPLALFLFFGIGFILNMVLKTTWLPTYISLGILVYCWFKFDGLVLYDLTILLFCVLGAVLSSFAIRTLRKKGYRMF